MRREGGRTLHYGAGSGVVGPHVADSEGEAKNYKRHAQHGVEGVPHTGPKPLLPYSTRTKGKRQTPSPDQSVADTQTFAEATRYPNGDKRGEALGTTDQHHQTPRGRGGQGGGQPQESTKQNQTKQQDQTQKQTNQQRRGRPPLPL